MFIGPNTNASKVSWGYDTGYPIVQSNLDSYRLNAGEPTYNYVSDNNNPFGSVSDWTEAGWAGDVEWSQAENAIELTATNGWHSIYYELGNDVISENMYVSFEYKLKSQQTSGIYGFVLNGTHLGSYTSSLGNFTSPSLTEWKTYTGSFTGHNSTNGTRICIGLRGTDNGGLTDTIYIKKLQVEKNNHHTPFAGLAFAYPPNGHGSRVAYTGSQGSGTGQFKPTSLKNIVQRYTYPAFSGTGFPTMVSSNDQVLKWKINVEDVTFNSNAQMEFDGTDDKMKGSWPALLNIDNTDKPRTWEVVFKTDTLTGTHCIFGHKASDGCSHYCNGGIRQSSNRVQFVWYDNASYQFLQGTTTLTTTSYYHVVAVWDESTLYPTLYVNGEEVGSWGSASNLNYSSGMQQYNVGFNSKSGGQHYFDGVIPIVKFYSNRLTATEIKQNFKGIKKRFNI